MFFILNAKITKMYNQQANGGQGGGTEAKNKIK